LKEVKILAARGPWPIDRSGRAIWKQRMRQKEYVWTGDDQSALVDALRGSPRSEKKKRNLLEHAWRGMSPMLDQSVQVELFCRTFSVQVVLVLVSPSEGPLQVAFDLA
jgi:hypothetical protein